MCLRPAWSAQGVPAQSGLHTETLSQKCLKSGGCWACVIVESGFVEDKRNIAYYESLKGQGEVRAGVLLPLSALGHFSGVCV